LQNRTIVTIATITIMALPSLVNSVWQLNQDSACPKRNVDLLCRLKDHAGF
jgi:hypothetical protein